MKLVIWLVIKLLIELQKFQKKLTKNNSETVTNKHDKEIPKERYISQEEEEEEGQESIDELRLKQYTNGI